MCLFVSVSLSVCIYVSLCLSVSLSLCLCLSVSLSLHVCLSVSVPHNVSSLSSALAAPRVSPSGGLGTRVQAGPLCGPRPCPHEALAGTGDAPRFPDWGFRPPADVTSMSRVGVRFNNVEIVPAMQFPSVGAVPRGRTRAEALVHIAVRTQMLLGPRRPQLPTPAGVSPLPPALPFPARPHRGASVRLRPQRPLLGVRVSGVRPLPRTDVRAVRGVWRRGVWAAGSCRGQVARGPKRSCLPGVMGHSLVQTATMLCRCVSPGGPPDARARSCPRASHGPSTPARAGHGNVEYRRLPGRRVQACLKAEDGRVPRSPWLASAVVWPRRLGCSLRGPSRAPASARPEQNQRLPLKPEHWSGRGSRRKEAGGGSWGRGPWAGVSEVCVLVSPV